MASQDLQAIRWQTSVDLNPQYNGSDLLIHYGSPVITPSNTVIVPVKTGAGGGFEVEAINGATGSVLWTQTTDYILPPHNWTPSYSPVLTAQNRLYFAGAGGTVYYIDNPDSSTPGAPVQLAFYGLSNYNANPSAYNSSVYIDTPLSADSQGDIFFGFRVTGSNPSGLSSGIARIGADGSGIWVSAASAARDGNIGEVPHNMAPALSNDESTLYVGVRSASTSNYGYLLGLDSATLATKYSSGVLKDPRNTGNAGLLDDSTASPMVGPDGDVYYGVMGNPYNGSRGFMLHFSSNLAIEKIPGAFGWDDIASIVPAAAVPSYTGTSSYLIFTKYNNYVAAEVGGTGGDGVNKIAILDPNAGQIDPRNDNTNIPVMKEILTIAGPTPDTQFVNAGYPNAVREWCINSAAVDPITHSVFANSEDGKLYRWNLDINTLSEVMTLTPGIGEAYTTTLIGPDGTVYATNNATLFAIDAATHFSISAPASSTAGSAFTITVTALDENNKTAVGYTGTVHFSTSAAKAVLPANYTFTGADAGVHSFSATLKSAGTQSITATDAVSSSISGPAVIVVNPAAPFKLAIARFPYKPTAGVAGSFRVTAQDMFGNTAPSFLDTVHFTSSDPQAVLPANYTFSSGDAGIHDFMATLKTVGSQSITVQDVTNTAIVSATQSNILIQPATASRLQVSGFPSSVTAGTAYNFTVRAFDPYNNVATGYRGTVMFSSSDPQAVLPANYPFTSTDSGAHVFSATLNTQGTQSITATDTANPSVTGTESGINVVSVQPTAGISGPSIGVPGQPLFYTLTASESGLPAETVYSYSVQWGDGSPVQNLSGPSRTQVSHAFTVSGNFSVSVTATDPNGHSSVPASTSVSITTLTMETDPYNSNQTALFVGGTTGNDNIAITPVAGGGVKVGMNMVNYGSFFPTGHVVVYSQTGNDIIKTAAQTINGMLTYVNVPVMFFAGNGNDILNVTGSSANNVLVGGGGMDRLLGGQGRDILIGGAGQATLNAGSSGDILIGGATAYDNNAAALAAILAEWSRTDIDYSTRMADLTNTTGGMNVINGMYFFLNNGMSGPRTVFGNGSTDNLYGGAGLDWFFAGMADVIFNKTSGEVVTQI